MRIDQPIDDIGVRLLRKQNTASGEVKQLRKVAPKSPLGHSDASHEELHEREETERRQGERRQRHTRPLLDTRDNQNRRQGARREEDRASDDDEAPPHGIDVTV